LKTFSICSYRPWETAGHRIQLAIVDVRTTWSIPMQRTRMVLRGTADRIALAAKLISEMDKPNAR
jgi:hypothetical protein